MRLPIALVLAGSSVAATAHVLDAKPVAGRRDLDPFDAPQEPCRRGKTWTAIERCLEKTLPVKARGLEVLWERTDAKVVAVPVASEMADLMLYRKLDKDWVRWGLRVRTNKTNELLRVDAIPTPSGDAIAVDVGSISRSWGVPIAAGVPALRGTLRRRFTHVCLASTPANCLTLVTMCEAYVAGKAYWAFRAEIVWHPTLGLRLRGDTRMAQGACKPLHGRMLEERDT